MRQDERRPFVGALQRAREAAYDPGEYVEQESFMGAGEIRTLAERAGIGPGVGVLDLCCGVAGPGRFLTRELGCDYLGVDSSESAVAVARERARDLPCRFEVAEIPPLPPGTFDVVLLLETMLAFPDKETMAEIVEVHYPGIRKKLVHEALTAFFEIREVPGMKKKPSTSELLDWLKLLLNEDITPEMLRERDPRKLIPPLHGALLKNEQDVHLFERLAFLSRREV